MPLVQVQKLHTLTGHRDCIYTLQRSNEEPIFFSASGDGMIVRWDLRDPENGEVIAKLPNSIYSIYHDDENQTLVAGHNYDGIHFLDWKNKKEIGSLQMTGAAIFDIQKFGKNYIVASGEGAITLVDPVSKTVVRKNQNSAKSARTIAVNEITGEIAVGYSDKFIRVFDDKLELKSEWQAHSKSVFTLRFIPDTSFLLSGSRDARLKVWDVRSGSKQVEEVVAHMYAINHVEFSPDGKHFVTCSMDKSIKVWDMQSFQLLKVIDRARHAGHGTSVNKLLWTRYNNQLLSASDDRTVSVWHVIF